MISLCNKLNDLQPNSLVYSLGKNQDFLQINRILYSYLPCHVLIMAAEECCFKYSTLASSTYVKLMI